jgi:16S rRNA (guanine527-N7)-methyltransferase
VADRLEELRGAWGLSDSTVGLLARLVRCLTIDRSAPTAVADPLEVVDAHVADSLTALSVDGIANARSMVDIGSGAGLPGLVLAAALPHAVVDMVESVGKKCAFIERAATTAGLATANVVCARAEEWGAQAGAGAYQWATARAVGRLATVLEYAASLLELEGMLVAWKGRREREEEDEAARAAEILGMSLVSIERVEPFAGSRNRHLHVYRKRAPSPPGYPRRPGMARKRPLGSAPNHSRPNQ